MVLALVFGWRWRRERERERVRARDREGDGDEDEACGKEIEQVPRRGSVQEALQGRELTEER